MDSMYNEIYGIYYLILEKLLTAAKKSEITLKDIHELVSQYGFSESGIYFTPEVISQKGEGYGLLLQTASGYRSVLQSPPAPYLTSMQKRFLKSMLSDPRIGLFLNEAMLLELNTTLADIPPLFNPDHILLRETAADCDDYSDPDYIQNFRKALTAIKENKALIIVFKNSKGQQKTMRLMPYKLEYGIRDDKFRLCGVSIYNRRNQKYVRLNLARILSIAIVNQSFQFNFEAFISSKRKQEPIEIEVYNLRNGFERIFIGLSNFERSSSFDEESGKCTIKLYYGEDDEQELLIQLLSYGPAIKVLGPEEFKARFVERIRKQQQMIKGLQP